MLMFFYSFQKYSGCVVPLIESKMQEFRDAGKSAYFDPHLPTMIIHAL